MSHSIKSGIITFEGKKYRLDKDDRLAAQAASLSQINSRKPVVTVSTGTGSLTIDQAGSLVSVSCSTTAVDPSIITLPAVAASGVNYDIVFSDTNNNIISASSGENVVWGQILHGANGFGAAGAMGSAVSGSAFSGSNGVKFNDGCAIGDRVNVVSDGTSWHVSGFVHSGSVAVGGAN